MAGEYSPSSEPAPVLPVEAREVYQRIIKCERVPEGTAGLGLLLDLGLITPDPGEPGAYVITDLRRAETLLRSRAEGQIEQALAHMSGIPALFDELSAELRRHGKARGGAASEFLDHVDLVNERIAQAIVRAESELLTSQPGPRSRTLLSKSVDRDMAALERGVAMRTLYHASARANPATREWAQMMTARGARVRTLASPFLRFVLVDRSSAVIQDYADGRDAQQGAWLVRDHALCGFIGEVFDQYWTRADEWLDAPTGDTVTTEVQRTILRDLCAGRDQAQIATRLGVSVRTITAHLADLRNRLELRTLHQVIYWWATSEERKLS
ncbi:LuxR C-terminal-related transcriptional regulator [Streptomyces sp. QH1-20]|uniref:LuxR C-terminal-related transcriptional regulator n=1 Tax=Streptomyces sp. QH1-20 TaxID=3240934 RepID=UPI00351604A0